MPHEESLQIWRGHGGRVLKAKFLKKYMNLHYVFPQNCGVFKPMNHLMEEYEYFLLQHLG